MSTWPMVKLGEVCDISMGQSPKGSNVNDQGDGIPIVGGMSEFSEDGVETNKWTSHPTRLCNPKDILLSVRATIGPWRIADKEYCLGRGIAGLRPSQGLDRVFLTAVLDAKREVLLSKARGATFLQITKTDLVELEIPLPPLEEQKRIAGILEASARQLEKVQTALDSLRQMRSSLIEEYCATSEVTVNLDSLASVAGGLSLSGKRAVNPIECEYLRVANIQRNRFLIDDVKTIRCTEKELDRCLVDDGDILMLEANANPYEVGRAAIAETFGRQFVFQNHLFRIRPVGISSIVLNALLESTYVRSQLLGVVKTTSGLNTMTINQARNLKVPQCASGENQRFFSKLEILDRQGRNLQERFNLLQELHRSLSTRAFAGEL